MNVLLLPYRQFEDFYVCRRPLNWKKMFNRVFSSFVWANLICISSICFLLLCHREYAARLLYVIECPFCLGRLWTASSPFWTEITSSYCHRDVLFPVFIVCMRSEHVKNLCMVLKIPAVWSMENQNLQDVNQRALSCSSSFPSASCSPPYWLKSWNITVNNNV